MGWKEKNTLPSAKFLTISNRAYEENNVGADLLKPLQLGAQRLEQLQKVSFK